MPGPEPFHIYLTCNCPTIQNSVQCSAKTVCSHIFVTVTTVCVSLIRICLNRRQNEWKRNSKNGERRRKCICFYSPCETTFFFPIIIVCQFSSSIRVEHIWHLKIFEKLLLLSVFIVYGLRVCVSSVYLNFHFSSLTLCVVNMHRATETHIHFARAQHHLIPQLHKMIKDIWR